MTGNKGTRLNIIIVNPHQCPNLAFVKIKIDFDRVKRSAMNIFFVIDDEIVTPQLTGSILPGITRDSVLQLSRSWGMKTIERRISIEEVMERIENGSLTEIFGAGTAAVISPVGVLHYKGKDHLIQDDIGPMAERFYDAVTGIQYGRTNDPFHWLEPID